MRSAGKPAAISNLPETGYFLVMARAEHAPHGLPARFQPDTKATP